VPLWKETAVGIRHWLNYADLRAHQSLVPNRNGLPMTRTNVADRLTLAITAATKQCPQLAGRKISPHSWRHTTAMHLFLKICKPMYADRRTGGPLRSRGLNK
jgi:integrase